MGGIEDDRTWYPTVEDILRIHEDIIAEDEQSEPGIRDPDRVDYAIDFIKGSLGESPETIHEKAFHLMRLIASNHWFADGNKRTALNSTELFYLVNGYELDYGDDIRSMLKLFSVRSGLLDRDAGPKYLRDRTTPIDFDEEMDPFGLLVVLLVALVADYSDEDLDDMLPEDELELESVREELGLTKDYGTTVNIGEEEPSVNDGG